ncbi:PucR family transcriptional regulator [Mycolicibacterium komossense]|uniref:PucR family transcriptional regulator n=1 Tax=Mycolicibacterium komossense TaxID=1779 RepID=A0ABT3CHQ1_9MYCO|nr:PucR family transcriptional regulator [Mycolicibacterium komossense]MCV7229064.1 PucR family transcriptional regulator [Mycolicibacterium komossense]
MSITVRQVLATPLLASADPEILTGTDKLDRVVRWLHPAEVADIAHLLRGGELVLITGIVLSEDVGAMHDYVQSLAAIGAAGLVVELGRRWTQVPHSLVNACQAADLVLVALHKIVRFAGVVEEVGAQILATQIADLQASEHIHETFTRLDVDAAGPEDILAAIAQIAGLPIVLESSSRQVIGYHLAGRQPKDVLPDWSRRSRGVGVVGRTGYDRPTGWLTTTVGSRGDDWGRLVMIADVPPTRREYVLIERGAAALSLHQMRARARDSVERNTHSSLIADLRALRITPELELRCEAANFPVRGRKFFAIAVRQDIVGESGRNWALTDVAATLAKVARTLNLSMLAGLETDHVIALISCPQSLSPDAILSGLTREVRKSLVINVARGEVVDRLELTYQTLIDAKSIMAATDPDDQRPWITLADVHLRGLLNLLRDDERLRLFARRELGPLLAYDNERGTSLLSCLEGFLETPGPKSAAAKRLLLSRPVLYERLAKIESVLGVQLEDPAIRTSLHVAVMVTSLCDKR